MADHTVSQTKPENSLFYRNRVNVKSLEALQESYGNKNNVNSDESQSKSAFKSRALLGQDNSQVGVAEPVKMSEMLDYQSVSSIQDEDVSEE